MTFLVVIVVGMAPAYLHAYVIRPGGVSSSAILAGDTVLVNHAAYHLSLPLARETLPYRFSRREMVLLVVPTNGVNAKTGHGIARRRSSSENRLVVNGQPVTVKTLNRSEFAWVPDADRMGSTVEDREGTGSILPKRRTSKSSADSAHADNTSYLETIEMRAQTRGYGDQSPRHHPGKSQYDSRDWSTRVKPLPGTQQA